MCDDIECETPDAILLVSLEEALVLRILSYRLLRELDTVEKPENFGEVKKVREVKKGGKPDETEKAGEEEDIYRVDFKGGVKAWLKTNERLRMVMKDILKHYGHSSRENSSNVISLAEIMLPLLEKTEGVLEDAIEFEARKKSTQKTKPETESRSGMDAPA